MISPTLTVIIPAYDEAGTIARVLDAVAAASYEKQVIVVDDGSTDGTAAAVDAWCRRTGAAVVLIRHSANRGKSTAIRTALAQARGEFVIVQDADLECHPGDYPRLMEPIRSGRVDAVFGSRYLRPDHALPWTWPRVCVCLLNLLVWLLYGRRLTDEACCYKLVRTDLLRRLDLRCRRFEFCPEVTAKLCRLGLAIREVPVRYTPRSRREGKKIGWRDGLEAIITLVWWRVAPFRPAGGPVRGKPRPA